MTTQLRSLRGFRDVLVTCAVVGMTTTVGCAAANGPDPNAFGAAAGDSGAPPAHCPEHPSCQDVDGNGDPCIPVCDPACQTEHVHYGFWVSTYAVTNTGGLGRHQGISMLGAELVYDRRAKLASSPDLATKYSWPDPLLPNLPTDMTSAMVGGTAIQAFPLCSAPKTFWDDAVYNHGRSLLRDPGNASNRVELLSHDVDIESGEQANEASDQTVRTCLATITDGYCDSVCGNCSYVLPSAGLSDIESGDWSSSSDLIFGTGAGQCSSAESYYGGVSMMSVPGLTGDLYPDPFTHCAWLGCDSDDEATSVNAYWWSTSAVVSGYYGHNSNADAEAEYRAFSACMTPGSSSPAQICAACGSGVGHQSPCADKTNLAATWWSRTATATSDEYPIIETANGPTTPDEPQCAWSSFRVQGM